MNLFPSTFPVIDFVVSFSVHVNVLIPLLVVIDASVSLINTFPFSSIGNVILYL